MIPELLEYIQELFPSISPYTAGAAKRALSQYESAGVMGSLTLSQVPEDMRQGDVYSEMTVPLVDASGRLKQYRLKTMLLTNTCDCVRNDFLAFAPIWPIDEYFPDPTKASGVKSNRAYQFLYLPDNRLADDVVDFGSIFSLPRTVFESLLENGSVSRIASLSWVGYYVFLAKLTVFFMRPEDSEVNESRGTA